MKPTLTERVLAVVGLKRNFDSQDKYAHLTSEERETLAVQTADRQFATSQGGKPGTPILDKSMARDTLTLSHPDMRPRQFVPPPEPEVKRLPIKRRLLDDPDLQEAKNIARHCMLVYEIEFDRLYEELFPVDALRVLRNQLDLAKTQEERDTLRQKIAAFGDEHSYLSARNSARADLLATHSYYAVAAKKLTGKALEILNGYLAEAVGSEQELFHAWGMPNEATSVSRRVRLVIAEMETLHRTFDPDNQQSSISRTSIPKRFDACVIIQWFGVKSVSPEDGDEAVSLLKQHADWLKSNGQ